MEAEVVKGVLVLAVLFAMVVGVGATSQHIQPTVSAVSPGLQAARFGVEIYSGSNRDYAHSFLKGRNKEGNIGMNFYLNPKVSQNGNVVRDGEEVCPRLPITIEAANVNGEWFGKGGPVDSPPVVFVSDLAAVKQGIQAGTFSVPVHQTWVCPIVAQWLVGNWADRFQQQCHAYTNVVCEQKCDPEPGAPNAVVDGGSVILPEEGEFELSVACEMDCIMFVKNPSHAEMYFSQQEAYDRAKRDWEWDNREKIKKGIDPDKGGFYFGPFTPSDYVYPGAYGYATLNGEIRPVQTLKVISKGKEDGPKPEVVISNVSGPPEMMKGSFAFFKLTLENSGEFEGLLDGFESSIGYTDVVSAPDEVPAEGTAEVIVRVLVEKEDTEPTFDVLYSAPDLACLSTRDFDTQLTLEKQIYAIPTYCDNDDGCGGGICCQNICRPIGEGICDDVDGDGVMDYVLFS